jgi:hypothetical protein
MRIARSPSTNEGMTALHVAAQSGRTDLVRYLLAKGANPTIADANGRTPIDLVGGTAGTGAPATNPAAAGTPPPRAGATAAAGRGNAQPGAAAVAESRALLRAAANGRTATP